MSTRFEIRFGIGLDHNNYKMHSERCIWKLRPWHRPCPGWVCLDSGISDVDGPPQQQQQSWAQEQYEVQRCGCKFLNHVLVSSSGCRFGGGPTSEVPQQVLQVSEAPQQVMQVSSGSMALIEMHTLPVLQVSEVQQPIAVVCLAKKQQLTCNWHRLLGGGHHR